MPHHSLCRQDGDVPSREKHDQGIQLTGMYSPKVVEAACGPKLAQYIKNKAKGGAAGQKGTRYEDRFALLKIGEAAERAFAGTGSFSSSWNISFRAQAPCFVDDLVVYRSAIRTADHYQAKNQAQISWGKGPKSLSSDFQNQLKLGKYQNIQTTVTVVVNSKNNAKNLQSSIPKDIRRGASVCYFPSDERLYKLLQYRPMRRGLTALLGSDPSDDHLVTVGRLLLAAWTETVNTKTLKKMIEELHKSNAPLLRPLKPVTAIHPELKAVLDSIPNFHYSLDKGFMSWRYGTTDRGCFSQHCGTAKFASFTQRVISRRPGSFADLEVEFE